MKKMLSAFCKYMKYIKQSTMITYSINYPAASGRSIKIRIYFISPQGAEHQPARLAGYAHLSRYAALSGFVQLTNFNALRF